MSNMRTVILVAGLALVGLATAVSGRDIGLTDKLRILPQSSLVIEGESNVNTFRYRFTAMPDDPSGRVIGDVQSVLSRLRNDALPLDVRSFDAGHGKMNRDFWNLLEADSHPDIIISVEELTALNRNGRPIAITSEDVSEIWVHAHFTIAGEKLLYAFPVNVDHDHNTVHLTGDLEINIEDFGLQAPTALFGLIKVRNRITIFFDLVLEHVA